MFFCLSIILFASDGYSLWMGRVRVMVRFITVYFHPLTWGPKTSNFGWQQIHSNIGWLETSNFGWLWHNSSLCKQRWVFFEWNLLPWYNHPYLNGSVRSENIHIWKQSIPMDTCTLTEPEYIHTYLATYIFLFCIHMYIHVYIHYACSGSYWCICICIHTYVAAISWHWAQ